MKTAIFIMLFTFTSYDIRAQQQRTIDGSVISTTGIPLQEANIFIKGTSHGCLSDTEGHFFITYQSSSKKDTLICRLPGYHQYISEITALNSSRQITLIEDPLFLKPVLIKAKIFPIPEVQGYSLNSLDVVSIPGAAADVLWAIQSLPGIQKAEEGAGLYVRGGDVSETAILLDGCYIFHPYRFESTTGGYLGRISPFLLKGIYFSAGGFGAEYTNSMSAVLSMESMDIPVLLKTSLSAGLAEYSARVSVPVIAEKLGFIAAVNYSNTRGMLRFNHSQLTRKFTTYPETAAISLNANYKYNMGQIKLFASADVDKSAFEVKTPDESSIMKNDGSGRILNLSLRHRLIEELVVSANAGYSEYYSRNRLRLLDIDSKEGLWQMRLSAVYPVSDAVNITAGIDGFLSHLKYHGTVPSDDEKQTYSYHQIYRSALTGLYLKSVIRVGSRFLYTCGIRYDRSSLIHGNAFSLRNSVSLLLSKGWEAVISIGRYNQQPSAELFDSQYGNPALVFQKSDHFILGIGRDSDSSVFRFEIYLKNYSSLVLNDSKYNYSNNGYGYSAGTDLFLKNDIGNLSYTLSLSYISAKRKWKSFRHLVPTRFDITYTFNAIAKYTLFYNLEIGLKNTFAYGKPYSDSQEKNNNRRMPNYHRVDMSVFYLHSFFENNLTIFYAGIDNLFGRRNISDYLYSADYSSRTEVISTLVRSFYFGLQFQF